MYRTLRFNVCHAILVVAFPLVSAAQVSAPATGSRETSSSTPLGITTPAVPPPSTELSSGGVNTTRSEAGLDIQPDRFPASPAERLKPVTRNDITFLCGGIGEEESAYMKQEASSYDLMLTFAARDGAYLADVNVEIADAKGKTLLQASCDSPLMLVDLPRAGNYRIRAEAGSHVVRRSVKVNAGRKSAQHLATVLLTWPQQVAESPSGRNAASGASGESGASGVGGHRGGEAARGVR